MAELRIEDSYRNVNVKNENGFSSHEWKKETKNTMYRSI